MAIVSALIPIISGKIGEYLYDKVENVVGDLDIKRKVKTFLGSKYQNPLIEKIKNSRRLKQLNKDKELLNKKLDFENGKLEKLNNSDSDAKIISKQVKKVSNIKKELNEIDSLANTELEQRINDEEYLENEINSLNALDAESEINEAHQKSLIKGVEAKEDHPSNLNKALEKSSKKKSIDNIKSKKKNQSNNSPLSSIESLAPSKKSRNITKKLGRPLGSKNKSIKESFEHDSTRSLDSIKESSFMGPVSSLTGEDQEYQQIINKKLLKNSTEQLEELEDVNKNLKDLTKTISKLENSPLSNLKDTLTSNPMGGPKSKMNKFVKGANMGGKLLGAAGLIFEGYNQYGEYQEEEDQNKQKLERGEVSKEEFDKLESKKKYKATGKAGGTLGGSALGGAIGQLLIPIPGVGFVIGAALGGMLGKSLGEKGGELAHEQLNKDPLPPIDPEPKITNTYNIQNYNTLAESELDDEEESYKSKSKTKQKLKKKDLKMPPIIEDKSNIKFEQTNKFSQDRINYYRDKRARTLNNISTSEEIAPVAFNENYSTNINSRIKEYDKEKENKQVETQKRINESSNVTNQAANSTIINNYNQSSGSQQQFKVEDDISASIRYSINS